MPFKSITFQNINGTTTEVSRNIITDVVQITDYDFITGVSRPRYLGDRNEDFNKFAHNILVDAGIDIHTDEYMSGVNILRSIVKDHKNPLSK